MQRRSPSTRAVFEFLSCAVSMVLAVIPAWAGGPLRVHPDNPRYFTDDSGKAIYLAGHQWFNDLQHAAWDFPVKVDWDRYLDFMEERKMNLCLIQPANEPLGFEA